MDLMLNNWLTIVIAAVLNMAINFVWYSHWLFGKQWMALAKIKEEQMKDQRGAIAWSLVVSLVLSFMLAWFIFNLGVTSVQDGLFVGFCAWLGFVATTQISKVIWCKKPFKLFLIETGNRLAALLVMGGILGA